MTTNTYNSAKTLQDKIALITQLLAIFPALAQGEVVDFAGITSRINALKTAPGAAAFADADILAFLNTRFTAMAAGINADAVALQTATTTSFNNL